MNQPQTQIRLVQTERRTRFIVAIRVTHARPDLRYLWPGHTAFRVLTASESRPKNGTREADAVKRPTACNHVSTAPVARPTAFGPRLVRVSTASIQRA